MWRWSHMLQSFWPSERRRVHINMDETNVRLVPPTARGHLVAAARKLLRARGSLSRPGSKGEARCSFTQMVFLCDDEEIQQALPTILLVGERVMNERQRREILSGLPHHVALWRQKRAWVTAQTMTRAIFMVAQALAPWRDNLEVIFSADTYRAHLTNAVWAAMNRHRFTYMLIPASMTWALQPCDTHLFATYKREVAAEFQARQVDLSNRRLSPPPPVATASDRWAARVTCLVGALCAAFEKQVRRKSWAHAFNSNGLGRHHTAISPRLLSQLGFSGPPTGTAMWPELSDFNHIFPKRCEIPLEAIFNFVTRPPRNPRTHVDRSEFGSAAARPPEFEAPASWPPRPSCVSTAIEARPPPGRIPRARRLALPRGP